MSPPPVHSKAPHTEDEPRGERACLGTLRQATELPQQPVETPVSPRVQRWRAGHWLGFLQTGRGDRDDGVQLASGRSGWALDILTSDLVLREMDVSAPPSVCQAQGRLQGCSTC